MAGWTSSLSPVLARRLVVAIGVAYVSLTLLWAARLFATGVPTGSIAIQSLLIGGPGLAVAVAGYRLDRIDVAPRYYAVVASWCVAGILAMCSLLVLYHLQPDDTLSGDFDAVSILTSVAAATGFGVGVYDGRAKTRAHELATSNRELRRTKRKLEAAIEDLEASNERLEEFAYAASHDLQEPLRMVSSYLQLLEARYGDVLDDEGEAFLEFAVDGADRMREMIDGLLAYSRVETAGDPFEPVDLADVLADVRRDLAVRLEESGGEVTADALPRVRGDERQLRQVLQNLLANAIEYSGEGAPQIHVSAIRRGPDWVISVEDEGEGIDATDRGRIFEVFQRLHTQEEHPGTGIGLALCQRIVQRHGGEIWVESEPGVGSTFSFTLRSVDGGGGRNVATPAGRHDAS